MPGQDSEKFWWAFLGFYQEKKLFHLASKRLTDGDALQLLGVLAQANSHIEYEYPLCFKNDGKYFEFLMEVQMREGLTLKD